jgi:hypothetical protein
MRKFNGQLNKDITELKTLHMKKDKTDFNKMKAEVMKRHNISKATVYREMKKEQPGYYKRPQYNPPIREITAKEKELVSGKLLKQTPIEEIRAQMEKETGESYSWDRIDKIRYEINTGEQTRKSKGIIDMRNHNSNGFEYESPHGKDMKLFLEEILNLEKIDPRSKMTINFKGYDLILGSDVRNEFHRWIANTAAGRGRDVIEVARITSKHLCAEQFRYFAQGKAHNMKDLIEGNKLLDGYESTGAVNPVDFELIVQTVKKFAPKAKRIDIVFEVSNLVYELGASKELMPDRKEENDALKKELRKNM